MSVWTALWAAWLAMFAVVEGWALLRKAPSDTFSEQVWAWFRTGPGRTTGGGWGFRSFALGAFLVWLALHLTLGWFS